METSHNRAGGAVLPLEHMRRVYGLAQRHGVPVHTDGARIFNAATALRAAPSAIAQYTDSVAFCVSKGLSAPVGSLLCGSTAYIERARAFRRMVGGNMRQAGPLAAAGIIALEKMVDRLHEDHATAKRLAAKLHALQASLVEPRDVETNIVKVQVPRQRATADEWSAALKKRGVLVNPCERYALRFVTHRHIGESDIDRSVSEFAAVWESLSAKRHEP
jgi:threonine aldolase